MRTKCPVVLMAAVLLAGCASFSNSNQGKLYRTMKDPEFGVWNYYEKDVDGVYSEPNLEYVARNGNKLNNLYATSGFYQGIAFVATCSNIKNDRSCDEYHYYMINQNAEIIADFSNYTIPVLRLCAPGHPSSIFVRDRKNGEASYDFPLFKDKENACAENRFTKPAFNSKRILVYDINLDRYGFFDFNGNLVIPSTFKMATQFYSDGIAHVVTEDNIAGTIDETGYFTPYDYACQTLIRDNIYQISQTGKVYNYKTDLRLNDGTYYISNDIIASTNANYENCHGSKIGLYSNSSKASMPSVYDSIELSNDNGFIRAIRGGIIDYYTYKYPIGKPYTEEDRKFVKITDSTLVSRVVYGKSSMLMKSASTGLWSVMDVDSGSGIQSGFIYDDVKYLGNIENFGEYYQDGGYIAVRRNNKYAIANCAGVESIPPEYDDVSIYRNNPNLMITKRKNKYGVVYDGFERYSPVFDSIGDFIDDRAIAKKDGKEYYLFINSEKEDEYLKSTHYKSKHGQSFIPPYAQ